MCSGGQHTKDVGGITHLIELASIMQEGWWIRRSTGTIQMNSFV